MTRDKIYASYIDEILGEVAVHLKEKIKEKGDGAFVSSHEADGVIDEEVREFKDALRSNDLIDIRKELWDIIISAIWGIISQHTWLEGQGGCSSYEERTINDVCDKENPC